ncbi:MAG: DUF479 domain-containing protein [Crocinitomicaceae bacterium]|nr:DUF479 domain-containing protein [Crocinitomicaceae bacterium]
MNYLAHAYLSFGGEELLFGNFIGDFVKGRTNNTLPDEIWKGVVLHREIDSFTDNHEATRQAKEMIRADLGLSSGIFIDMIFDHILANEWQHYSDIKLEEFTQKTYESMGQFEIHFPDKFAYMFHHMRKDDWLKHYKDEFYMNRFLAGVSRRLKAENYLQGSFVLYKMNQKELDVCFHSLFEDLIEFSRSYNNQTIRQI